MRILFGPEHDGLHISPETPGAYEWWYFDALSDDGRFALVAIFFLGTPMSPYYKAVVDGKNPLPKDWSAVFFTLHEKVKGRWQERAYTYNLYRDAHFSDTPLNIRIGKSRLRECSASPEKGFAHAWHLQIDEPKLWRGTVQADLHFFVDQPLPIVAPQPGADDAHNWVCVAPQTRMVGKVTLPTGEVPVYSHGYHDHNWGQLPWHDVSLWYWGRAHWLADAAQTESFPTNQVIVYGTEYTSGEREDYVLHFDVLGRLLTKPEAGKITPLYPFRNAYGMQHPRTLTFEAPLKDGSNIEGDLSFPLQEGALTEGPFYRRLPLQLRAAQGGYQEKIMGEGIGEVFRPARLCGPIASRAMWTRIRRRS